MCLDDTKTSIPWVRGAPFLEARNAKGQYFQFPPQYRSADKIAQHTIDVMSNKATPQEDPLHQNSGGALTGGAWNTYFN